MNQNLVHALSEIRNHPDRPHNSCPGYEIWFAQQVWEAATRHCAGMVGPMCSDAILAAGVACCEMDNQL